MSPSHDHQDTSTFFSYLGCTGSSPTDLLAYLSPIRASANLARGSGSSWFWTAKKQSLAPKISIQVSDFPESKAVLREEGFLCASHTLALLRGACYLQLTQGAFQKLDFRKQSPEASYTMQPTPVCMDRWHGADTTDRAPYTHVALRQGLEKVIHSWQAGHNHSLRQPFLFPVYFARLFSLSGHSSHKTVCHLTPLPSSRSLLICFLVKNCTRPLLEDIQVINSCWRTRRHSIQWCSNCYGDCDPVNNLCPYSYKQL